MNDRRHRAERTRVLRVITRLNIGGPAYHVSILSGQLDPDRYETLLVSGSLGEGEGSAYDLPARYGARLEVIRELTPRIDLRQDLRALRALGQIVRKFEPHIVHTHTAKAGAIGRAAAVLASSERPILVHTFHGHVLDRFFGPIASQAARAVERSLARVTDCLIGVSDATVADLARLRIAPRSKLRVVPLGLDLDAFFDVPASPRSRDKTVRFIFCGRLVPTKRVDMMLRAVALALPRASAVRLQIIGDGNLRPDLERLASELKLDGVVEFAGFRRDVADLLKGADVAILTSVSEGTPVFLIEASAAGLPAIATNVDGVSDVVAPGAGILVAPTDENALADGITALASDPARRRRMGEAARGHVRERFTSTRLLADINELYGDLLKTRQAGSR